LGKGLKTVSLSRREFLKTVFAGALAATSLSTLGFQVARALPPPKTKLTAGQKIPSVCPYCAVGCTVIGTVVDGEVVDVGPDLEAPHTRGTLCSKGQASMGLLPQFNPYRLRRPLLRQNPQKGEGVDPQWKEITWEEAFEIIEKKWAEIYLPWLKRIREEWKRTGKYIIPGGRDFSKNPNGEMDLDPLALPYAQISGDYLSNEEAYLNRKLAMLMGTNNCDIQARRCHSTTVAGLADVFGFGAMTNGPDVQFAKVILQFGSNAAEQHPVFFQWIMRAKERGAKYLVFDPRFTRSASKADMFAWFRPGTEMAFLWGIANLAIQRNVVDWEYLSTRTDAPRALRDAEYGALQRITGKSPDELKAMGVKTVWDAFKLVVSKYTPDEVSRITGIPADKFVRMAEVFIDPRNRPGSIVWCIGATQHTCGTQIIRATGQLQLLLGNMGKPGGGGNVLRGISNVQGSNDMNHKQDLWLGYRRVPGALGERLLLFGAKSPIEAGEKDIRLYQKYKNMVKEGKSAAEIAKALGLAWVADLRHYASWRAAEIHWGIFIGTVPESDPDNAPIVISDVPAGPGLTTIEYFRLMEDGKIKFLIIDAMNPVVSVGNANQVIRGLSAPGTFTVVMDLFLSETAHFADIVLPGASRYEGSGSVTNTSRWIHWRHRLQDDSKVKDPFDPQGRTFSDIKTSLWRIDQTFKRLRKKGLLKLPSEIYAEDSGTPIATLRSLSGGKNVDEKWNYRNPKTGEDPDFFEVSKEINATVRIYTGIVGPNGENRMARRSKAFAGLYDATFELWKNWAFSWPDNQRILYNLEETEGKTGPLGNDFFKPPFPDDPTGRGRATFWSALYARRNLPIPDYTEPADTPDPELARKYPPLVGDHPYFERYGIKPLTFHPANTFKNKLVVNTVEEGYDVILTTFRLTEHQHTGQLTRHIPWLAEMMPEHFVEISPSLARKLGVRSGDLVKVSNKRHPEGIITKALVTKRVSPLLINNRLFEVIAMPWAYGFSGPVTGPITNKLVSDAADDETAMPETKVALVKVERVV